jgi:uncharacterized protein (DUF305 family)
MMNAQQGFRAVFGMMFAAALMVGAGSVGYSSNHTHSNHSMAGMAGMGNSSGNALAKLSGANYDIAWLSQMIEHHRGALEMSRWCVASCQDKDVRAAASKIITDQDKEIIQMTTWLGSWYKAKPLAAQMKLMEADMKPMMDSTRASMTPMAGMRMPIDRSFLEGMIIHHQHAVMMGNDASKRAAKAELKSFAAAVVKVQTAEIAQYQGWLKGKKL